MAKTRRGNSRWTSHAANGTKAFRLGPSEQTAVNVVATVGDVAKVGHEQKVESTQEAETVSKLKIPHTAVWG